jgi:hypothetical protein
LESITAPADANAPGQIVADLLPTIGGYKEVGTEKVATEAGMQAPKINFIGDCTLITDVDGTITVRIGPNLNHSQFGQADGHSDYASLKVNKLADVAAPNVTDSKTVRTDAISANDKTFDTSKTGNITIDTYTPTAVMHFDSVSRFCICC